MLKRRSKKLRDFSAETKRLIRNRAGDACERCRVSVVNGEIDHRRTRGAGGTNRPSTNEASNGALLCSPCHEWKHAHPNEARETGWYVSQWEHPETVPMTDLAGNQFIFDGDRKVNL